MFTFYFRFHACSALNKIFGWALTLQNPWVSVNTIYIPVQYIPQSFISGLLYTLLRCVLTTEMFYLIYVILQCLGHLRKSSSIYLLHFISHRKGMNFVRVKSDPAVFLFFIFCSYEIRIRRDEVLQDVLLKGEYEIIAWYYENGHTVHSLHEK